MASALPVLVVLLVLFPHLAIFAAGSAAESSSHLETMKPSDEHQLCAANRFAFFPGRPRWVRKRPIILTYSLSRSNTIDYISHHDLSAALRRAFSRWTGASQVSFIEIDDYDAADVKVGFYLGDHGDGMPFDPLTNVLGHAFEPEGGEIHLNKNWLWTISNHGKSSPFVVEFESVVMHEIGHVLGLAHSTMEDSIMYPALSSKRRKLELSEDDVAGIQELYKQEDDLNYMASSPDVIIGFIRSFFIIMRASLALFILSIV